MPSLNINVLKPHSVQLVRNGPLLVMHASGFEHGLQSRSSPLLYPSGHVEFAVPVGTGLHFVLSFRSWPKPFWQEMHFRVIFSHLEHPSSHAVSCQKGKKKTKEKYKILPWLLPVKAAWCRLSACIVGPARETRIFPSALHCPFRQLLVVHVCSRLLTSEALGVKRKLYIWSQSYGEGQGLHAGPTNPETQYWHEGPVNPSSQAHFPKAVRRS